MSDSGVISEKKTPISAETWAEIRAKFEVGASILSLSKEYKIIYTQIYTRSKKEGWTRDAEEAIQKAAGDAVAGIEPEYFPDDPKSKAIAVEAKKRANVVKRHRREWEQIEELRQGVLKSRDFDEAKFMKINFESLMIKQSGERKAWGLDTQENKQKVEVSGPNGESISFKPNLDGLSTEQLSALSGIADNLKKQRPG